MVLGMYKGKSLEGVQGAIRRKCGTIQAREKYLEYLSVLVSMGWREKKPAFRIAWEGAVIWATVFAKAPATQQAIAKRALEKTRGEQEQGP